MGTWQRSVFQRMLKLMLPITWPIDPAGNSRSAPPSRGPPPSYSGSGGSSRYDDFGSSSRDGYGSRDSYPSSRSDPYSASRGERLGRQERGSPPLERGYPRQYRSSSRGAPRGGGRGGSRGDRGMARNRYWDSGEKKQRRNDCFALKWSKDFKVPKKRPFKLWTSSFRFKLYSHLWRLYFTFYFVSFFFILFYFSFFLLPASHLMVPLQI